MLSEPVITSPAIDPVAPWDSVTAGKLLANIVEAEAQPRRVPTGVEGEHHPGLLTLGGAYHHEARRPATTAHAVAEWLREHRVDFDTVVATGTSGSAVAPIVAAEMGKQLVLVRRDRHDAEQSHSSRMAVGMLGKRWIMVDDLVDSGATLKHVYDVITSTAERFAFTTRFVGVFEYNAMDLDTDPYPLQPKGY